MWGWHARQRQKISKCSEAKVCLCLECLRNSKKASVAEELKKAELAGQRVIGRVLKR